MFVNLLALIYTCISRPFKDSLLNAHTIINDVGVLIVIGEFFMMRSPYYSDAEYYMQGKIIIATIAIIIWINFVLFIISFILGLIDFLKRCPHCLCCICNKKHLRKDQIIIDQEFPIDKGPID
jgi:hypothetical protein